nr:hypothetical protein HK105_000465 [Polyrhizophydium stewartii]
MPLPEKTLGMHDWMALGSQAIMVRGNEMHVSTLPDGHVLVKRSSTGKCLGVSNRAVEDELVNSAQVGDLAMLVGVPDGKYAFGKTWESSTAQMSIKLNNMARLRWV